MRIEIEIKGVGGQGIKRLADIIYSSILTKDSSLNVSLGQDYDSVVRGGISNSHLIISDTEIINPALEDVDIVIDIINGLIILYHSENGEPKTIEIPKEKLKRKNHHKGLFLIGVLAGMEDPFFEHKLLEKTIMKMFAKDSVSQCQNLKAFNDGVAFGKTKN